MLIPLVTLPKQASLCCRIPLCSSFVKQNISSKFLTTLYGTYLVPLFYTIPQPKGALKTPGVISARAEVGSAVGSALCSPHPSHSWTSRGGGVAAGFGSTRCFLLGSVIWHSACPQVSERGSCTSKHWEKWFLLGTFPPSHPEKAVAREQGLVQL